MRPMSAAPTADSFSTSVMARATARGSRASRRSEREDSLMPSKTAASSPEHLPRDDETLNLARALADGAQLDVSKIFLGRIVFDEAVPAVDLDALFGGTDSDFTRVELRDRRLARRADGARIFHPRGAIRQQPGGLDADRHVGQLPLNRLKARDGLAELVPLFRIAEGRLIGALREADGHGRNANPAGVEHLQRVDEPLSFDAD